MKGELICSFVDLGINPTIDERCRSMGYHTMSLRMRGMVEDPAADAARVPDRNLLRFESVLFAMPSQAGWVGPEVRVSRVEQFAPS
jgi:hypothetical protein